VRATGRKHYKNSEVPGQTVFVTTTVLDFVHAFARSEPKDQMVVCIARACRQMDTLLHGYVVMPHHVHLLITLGKEFNVRRFMQRFKPVSGAKVARLLTKEELSGFAAQSGLNRNTFWQRSFRSYVADNDRLFNQKLDYIHENPVSAGYVVRPVDYRWSSASLIEAGHYDVRTGLDIDAVLESVRG
jgi:REP element-mobilizing transposase RayT